MSSTEDEDGGRMLPIGDFEWTWTGVRVRKTGAWVPFDAAHLHEIAVWCLYFAEVWLRSRMIAGTGPVIGFAPDAPRPWYLLWPALALAGGRAAKPGERPDVWLHFEDSTISEPPAFPADGAPRWNVRALDLSKSAVAAAFEAVTGRALGVDPAAFRGEAVEKGAANGVHDGRIVALPMQPAPGKVYQRLIDARADDGMVEDLRTPTVAGRPVCVFIKRRHADRRFTNDNDACVLRAVDEVFSPSEQAMITSFCRHLGLDWGGLDILRHRDDGSLWIVDVNRTDMGPPIALPRADKLRATRALASALAVAVGEAASNVAESPHSAFQSQSRTKPGGMPAGA